MKFLWYFISFCTVLLILINNPKVSSIGNIGNQGQAFSFTRSNKKTLEVITIINILIFFILTINFVLYISI